MMGSENVVQQIFNLRAENLKKLAKFGSVF
jgi:hypothetical protein